MQTSHKFITQIVYLGIKTDWSSVLQACWLATKLLGTNFLLFLSACPMSIKWVDETVMDFVVHRLYFKLSRFID